MMSQVTTVTNSIPFVYFSGGKQLKDDIFFNILNKRITITYLEEIVQIH